MSYADRTPPTPEEFAAYRQRLSNWGRWGVEDQLGTLNFITPEVRRAAAALVREGRSVSCSNPLATRAVVEDKFRNARPAEVVLSINRETGGATDHIAVGYHGFVNTHIDALCHIWAADGQLYNGRPSTLLHEDGARTNSVEHWRDGIVTRGVLYDIPAMRGQPHVDFDAPVEGWHLEDFAREHGITPRAGDAVLVRSGGAPFWAAHPDFHITYPLNTPGVAASVLEFLYHTDAALLHGTSWRRSAGLRRHDADPPHRHPLHGAAASRQRQLRAALRGLRGDRALRVHADGGAARGERGHGLPGEPDRHRSERPRAEVRGWVVARST